MKEFKVGDNVDFVCCPYLAKPIVVSGKILKIYETVMGAKVKKLVAQIGELKNYPFNKSTTTISLDKLKNRP